MALGKMALVGGRMALAQMALVGGRMALVKMALVGGVGWLYVGRVEEELGHAEPLVVQRQQLLRPPLVRVLLPRALVPPLGGGVAADVAPV